METIIFAIITYVGWGAGDVFGALISRKIGSYSAVAWFDLLFLAVSICLLPFFWKSACKFDC